MNPYPMYLDNFPEWWLIGKEHGKIVALVNITVMPTCTLEIILQHWDDIGRAFEYKLRF